MPSAGKITGIFALENWRAHQNVNSQDLWRFVTCYYFRSHPVFMYDDPSVPGCGGPDDRMIVEWWWIVKRKNYLRKWLWPKVRYCRLLCQYKVRKNRSKSGVNGLCPGFD